MQGVFTWQCVCFLCLLFVDTPVHPEVFPMKKTAKVLYIIPLGLISLEARMDGKSLQVRV